MVRNLSEPCGFRHFDAAASCREVLCNRGYGAPGWRVLPTAQPEGLAARVPGVLAIPHEGWQRDASSFLEQLFLDSVLPRVSLMSAHCSAPGQGGPLAALPFTAMPVSPQQRFDSDIFRVLLLRRLSLPLPLSHSCRCGRPLDCLGHHRASCALASVLGRRGFALESAAARVCHEAGAGVSTDVFLRDLDLVGMCVQDQRRIKVIAEGLPIFHGAQLAIDTTLVSPLRADGEPHRRCGVQRLMEQLWRLLDAARSVLIQSWSVTVNVQSWLSLLGRLADVSQKRHTRLSVSSPGRRPAPYQSRCALVLANPGCSDGGLFWLVPLPGRLRLRCWIVGATREQMAPSDAEVLGVFSRVPPVVG